MNYLLLTPDRTSIQSRGFSDTKPAAPVLVYGTAKPVGPGQSANGLALRTLTEIDKAIQTHAFKGIKDLDQFFRAADIVKKNFDSKVWFFHRLFCGSKIKKVEEAYQSIQTMRSSAYRYALAAKHGASPKVLQNILSEMNHTDRKKCQCLLGGTLCAAAKRGDLTAVKNMLRALDKDGLSYTEEMRLAALKAAREATGTTKPNAEIINLLHMSIAEGMEEACKEARPTPSVSPLSPIESMPSSSPNDLTDIKQQLLAQTWPAALQSDVDQIITQINLFTDPSQPGGTPQNNLPSLQAYVHLHVKELFDSWIYQRPGVTSQILTNLLTIVGCADFVPPAEFPSKDQFPAPSTNTIPYLFKNLKETDSIVLDAMGNKQMKATDLPLINGVRYFPVPYGYSGRIYISNDQQGDFHTWPFLELTVESCGRVWTNFTAVDDVAKLPLTLQRVGNNEWNGLQARDPGLDSRVVGINQNFDAFARTMQDFYTQWDTTSDKAWLNTMFNTDGTIKSGKNMTAPTIITGLSNKVTELTNYYTQANPMHFIGDGDDGHGGPNLCSGYFENDANGQLYFISSSPEDPTRTFRQAIPSPLDTQNGGMGAWVSGGEGAWDIAPITQDAQGHDTTDWPKRNANWGVAKALTGLINTGIPHTMIGTIANPMGGASWTAPANIANYYKADFYNLYVRVTQASGCNAYDCDFGDVVGADGTLVGKPGDNDNVIVTLHYQSYTESNSRIGIWQEGSSDFLAGARDIARGKD